MGLGPTFMGAIAQWKRVRHWKIHVKNPQFVLTYGHELCPVESKCVAHLRLLMRIKIMLNNEDTLRFWQHLENFSWNFFRTCDTKIVIKSQHQHEIRSGLRHSIPKTCKIMSEWANLHRPTILAHRTHIYPGLCIAWYILYFNNVSVTTLFPTEIIFSRPCLNFLYHFLTCWMLIVNSP